MSSDRDVESRIERWLAADAQPMPKHVLDAVHEVVPRTGQLGPRGRFDSERWGGYVRVALAVAAVIVVAAVGPTAVDQLRNVIPGVAGPSPTPALSPTPTLSPTPSTSPTTGPTVSLDPFTGLWWTIDVDGSLMSVSFAGTGATRELAFVDQRATYCAGGAFEQTGLGTVEGDAIHVDGTAGCVGGSAGLPFQTTWRYDSSTDTLGDGTNTWSRRGLTEAFIGIWTATDVDGSALTLSFGGSGLTRNVAFLDDSAAGVCAGVSFGARGAGTIGSVPGDGRFITVSMIGRCDGGANDITYVEKYEYARATDTLIGPLAPLAVGGTPQASTVTWHRP